MWVIVLVSIVAPEEVFQEKFRAGFVFSDGTMEVCDLFRVVL